MTPDNNSTEGNRARKETSGSISSEDMDTVIESEVEHGTEGEGTSRQLMIRSGTQFLATHGYKKNQEGPVGNELDLNEGLLDEARRQRALVAGRGRKGAGGLCVSGISHEHRR